MQKKILNSDWPNLGLPVRGRGETGRDEKYLFWAGHVIWVYLTPILVKEWRNILIITRSLFICSEVWHESAEISEDTVDVFWRLVDWYSGQLRLADRCH